MGMFLRQMRVYLFGKGFMHLAVLGAGAVAALNPALSFVLPIVAIGGVALTVVNRLYRETLYQQQMVDLYRGDIAEQLGIAPEEVTRAHLKEAAKNNDIIDQALTRQRHKTWLAIGASVLASSVTFGLVSVFGADSWLRTAAQGVFNSGWAASAANFIGIGTVSAISSLFLNTGLQEVVEATTPLGKAAAHDRILEMEYSLSRGKAISAEQVYGVLVAADPNLQRVIQRQFHKPYAHMNAREQTQLLATTGTAPEMLAVAQQINSGQLRPGQLASYVSGTARVEQPVHQPAHHTPHGSFVEKLGLAPKAAISHRERVDAQRAALAQAERGV